MAGINLKNAHVIRALDSNGDAVSGAKLYVYDAGTTDAVTTYSDVELNTANAHPVVADSAGSWGAIYVPVGNYKVDVTNDAGTSLPGYPVDNVTVAGTSGADVETRNDVTSTAIDPTVDYIRTAGYATVGDGGGALYKRVGSEPSHELKVQSADGAWWELVPDPGGISVKQAGAKGDDTTDDGQAFLDAIAGVEDFNASGVNVATSPVIVPPGGYYLGDSTLNLKRVVTLRGFGSSRDNQVKPSQLRWDANITGIIINKEDTTGATTEGTGTGTAGGSIIEGLKLKSDGGTIASVTDITKGHGIVMRKMAVIRDVWVTEFPGDGLHIRADLGGGGEQEGNANTFYLNSVRSSRNHQNGVYVDDADANAGIGINVDVVDNGRWGINDSSFLGNTWIACHSSANGKKNKGENGASESSFVDFGGNKYAAHRDATEAELVATEPGTDESVWRLLGSGSADVTWTASQPEGTFFPGGDYATDNASARNLFENCYVEGNSAPPQFVKPTLVLGGKGMQSSLGPIGMIIGTISGPEDLHGSWNVLGDLVVDDKLEHSGTTAGFLGATPRTQIADARQAQLTNNTGGSSAADALAAVSGSGDDSTINDNFTEIHDLLDQCRSALVLFGFLKGSS